MADFVAVGKRLTVTVSAAELDSLAAEAPFATPMGHNDTASVLSFLHVHEAYHIGQLVLIRRLQEMAGLA